MEVKLRVKNTIQRICNRYRYVFRSTDLTQDVEEDPTAGQKILEAESIKAEIFDNPKN